MLKQIEPNLSPDSNGNKRYLDYWKEETRRLDFNINYLKQQTEENLNNLFWFKWDLTTGALGPNGMLRFRNCLATRDYLLALYRPLAGDPSLCYSFWKYSRESAFNWTVQLLELMLFDDENKTVGDPKEELPNYRGLNQLVLAALFALIKPFLKPDGDSTASAKVPGQLKQAIYLVLSRHRIATNLTADYSDVILKSFTTLVANFANTCDKLAESIHRDLEQTCRHNFADHPDSQLNSALDMEANRIRLTISKDYSCCGLLCITRLKFGKQFIIYNGKPSRLAQFRPTRRIANQLLEHPFIRDHDPKSEFNLGMPCQCLALIHHKTLINSWIEYMALVFLRPGKKSRPKKNGRPRLKYSEVLDQIRLHYGSPGSTFRRDFEAWLAETQRKMDRSPVSNVID